MSSDTDALQQQNDALATRIATLQGEEDAVQREIADMNMRATHIMNEACTVQISNPARYHQLTEQHGKLRIEISQILMSRGQPSEVYKARHREIMNLRATKTHLSSQLAKMKREAHTSLRAEHRESQRVQKESQQQKMAETKQRLADTKNDLKLRMAHKKAELQEKALAQREQTGGGARAAMLGNDFDSLGRDAQRERVAEVRERALLNIAQRSAAAAAAASTAMATASSSSSPDSTDNRNNKNNVVDSSHATATSSSSSSSATTTTTLPGASPNSNDNSISSSGLDPILDAELAKLPRQFVYDEDDVEVLEFIAAGGGGSVYKCRIPSLGERLCAGKTFSSTATKDAIKEVLISKNLHHPNLIQTLGVCVTSRACGGRKKELLMLMELGEGSLATLLKAASSTTNTGASSKSPTTTTDTKKKNSGDDDSERSSNSESSDSDDDERQQQEEPTHNLPLDLCLDYAMQISAGLACLHNNKILHLDLKPQNILLVSRTLKLCDFGLARTQEIDRTSTDVTVQGAGTLRFLPPEALNSTRTRASRDIYSFGVCLLWLITGREPFGRSASVFKIVSTRLIDAMPPARPGCPESLMQLARECLDPDQKKRPKDGAVLVARLQQCILEHEGMLTGNKPSASDSGTFSMGNDARQISAASSVLVAQQTSNLLASAQQQSSAASGASGAEGGDAAAGGGAEEHTQVIFGDDDDDDMWE